MTNFEKYIDEISWVIAVDEITKELKTCHDFACEDCLFGIHDNCVEEVKAWLNREYKGPVTVTPQEKALLDMLEDNTKIKTRSGYADSTYIVIVRDDGNYTNLELSLFEGLDFEWLDGEFHEVSEFRNAKVRDSGE